MKITNDILYVGVNDHKVDLFEGQYDVPNGMAYNSYVIRDKKIAVIKEDYGDALAPYLSYNYGEVHIIDYRYFDTTGIKFSDYCSQNGITDVLIVNDVTSAGSQTQIDTLKNI